MNLKTIPQLEAELARHRDELRQLRNRLAAAESHFMADRTDGSAVTSLRNEIHLAELRIAGCERDLVRLRTPATIEVTSSRSDLVARRDRIHQRIAFQKRQRDEQIQQIRAAHPIGTPEAHIAIDIRNNLGPSDYARKKQEQADAAELANVEAQLAELAASGAA